MERPPLFPPCPETCPGDFACSDEGRCLRVCNDDSECAEGFTCDYIFEDCNPRCRDEACPGGYTCGADYRCSDTCEGDSDCKDGYICNDLDECWPE